MNKWFFVAFICVALVSAYALVSRGQQQPPNDSVDFSSEFSWTGAPPSRVVSLAPSITEVLFALGQGERVVGVTQYCRFPAEAKAKAKIGGFHDINYELIVRLKPDLVTLIPSHREAKTHFAELGVATLTVDQTSLDSILTSIHTLGKMCGASSMAKDLVDRLQAEITEVEEKTANRRRPNVLICIDRDRSTGKVDAIHIAGNSGFYHEILRAAGGENVYNDTVVKYPLLSTEAILRLNPEVIIEMVPELDDKGWNTTELAAHWDQLPGLSAVRSRRVYVFGGDYVSIPGPRITRLLHEVTAALHPQLELSGQ